jgi:hypothetical protein
VKRKGFRTSPSVRLPRTVVDRLKQSKDQAQAQAQEIAELKGSVRIAYRKGLADGISACLNPSTDPHWPEDCIEAIEWWKKFTDCRYLEEMFLKAMRDLMAFFEKLEGSSGSWTVAEVKRIAAIRRLVRGA